MDPLRFCRLPLALAGAVLLTMSQWAGAEPPSRAARLGYISGTVNFSPAGDDDWRRARINRPLTTGDRLWVEDNARAELQIGGAAIRLGGGTSLTLLNLDDRIVQLQLTEGSLRVRVHRLGRNQAFEVNTPNLAFTMSRVGEYRIDVDANDDATEVQVRSGRGEAYGERRSYALNAGQGFRFYGTGLSDYDRHAARDDELDRWARERDRRYTTSVSARYVSGDVVGYEELDSYGTWRKDPTYGNVWAPNRVASGWTPYRDGHWAWIDPWGWTWVDDQPWGYAVSHYGRWANVRGSWVWVPGPRTQPAVYAPAQVAFVGGGQNSRLSVSVGGAAAALIGWFALAPGEVYQPSYQASRGYFDRVNRSNAAIAPATITNIYNTTIVNKTVHKTVYVNQRVQGAVVAVPPQAFTQAQPVAKAAVPVSRESAAAAQAAPVAAVAPERQSVHGGAPAADGRPRARERRVVARTAPPPPPAAFAAQQPALAATPGRPVDDTQRGRLKPAPAAAAPQPAVVTTVQAPAPSAPPPAVAPAAKSTDERRADSNRREGRGEGRKGDRDSAKADAAKGDAAKAEAAKAEAAKADAAKADAAKSAAAKADASKAEAAKAEAARQDAAKAEAARADAAKADAAKGEERGRGRDKADAARSDREKGEAGRREAAKAEAAKADAVKAAAERAAAEKVAAEKAAAADAAKAAAAKAEASRVDASKAEAAKAEAARAAAAKAAANKAAADKAAAEKAAAADAAKAAAVKSEASRAEAAKAEAARATAAKAAADKAATEKAAAEKAAAEKAAAEKAAAEAAKAAAGKTDSARADAKAAREKARAMRTDAEKAEDDKKKGAN